MKIVYDESKRLQNLAKHDLDFAELTIEFFENAVVLPAKPVGSWLSTFC